MSYSRATSGVSFFAKTVFHDQCPKSFVYMMSSYYQVDFNFVIHIFI